DRDRSEWSWTHGQIEMGTIYLDPNQYLSEHLTEQGADTPGDAALFGATQVGHIHLSVGDITTASDFYLGVLGFDQTVRMGDSALFVSAGGYHHHMAMNVWSSHGAGPRMPALGLGRVDIALSSADGVDELSDRLAHGGIQRADDGRDLSFTDPWNNLITVTAPERG
ncbi:MAG: VOC family protein, partial [Mycetocola sp.]